MLRRFLVLLLVFPAVLSCLAQEDAQIAGTAPLPYRSYTANASAEPTRVPPVLSGTVKREDNQPVHDAHVTLACDGVERGSATAKPDGQFALVVQRPQNGLRSAVLAGCEIFATLGGSRSSSRRVASLRDAETSDVGTLVLHAAYSDQGSTVSVKSLLAPAGAKKFLNQGTREASSQKWSDAERSLRRATDIYPQFAEAWHELGLVLQRLGRREDARHAFKQALATDPQFIRPYYGLVGLAAEAQDWLEMQRISDAGTRLMADPMMFFYHAIASFNLQQFELSERSLRNAAALDPQHQVPQIDLLLGDILIQRHDYLGAAAEVREFLAHAPDGPQAQSARVELTRLEQLSSQR